MTINTDDKSILFNPKFVTKEEYMKSAQKTIKEEHAGPVPLHLWNAPTQLMKEKGYGAEYKYPHDFPYHFVPQEYLPKGLEGKKFYFPTDYGFEKEIRKRIEFWAALARQKEKKEKK